MHPARQGQHSVGLLSWAQLGQAHAMRCRKERAQHRGWQTRKSESVRLVAACLTPEYACRLSLKTRLHDTAKPQKIPSFPPKWLGAAHALPSSKVDRHSTSLVGNKHGSVLDLPSVINKAYLNCWVPGCSARQVRAAGCQVALHGRARSTSPELSQAAATRKQLLTQLLSTTLSAKAHQ